MSERFIQHVLTDEQRIATYSRKLGAGERFLDVGCGAGALTKVASSNFSMVVACDVAFRWLIVARKRLQEAGMPANLVCCCADYLPFRSQMFDSVAAISLLEHMPNPQNAICEFSRVACTGADIFVLTTNRFSLAPEPHVRVWGVGFLPRSWMPAYVKWRRGLAYEKKRLLSCFEVRRLMQQAGLTRLKFSLPVVTKADLDNLGWLERTLGRIFNGFARFPVLRLFLLLFTPVIQALAQKSTMPGEATLPVSATKGAAVSR